MFKNRLKKVTCGLLAGTMIVSSVGVVDTGITASANTVISSTTKVGDSVGTPAGVRLRDLFEWTKFASQGLSESDVYNHSVYHASALEMNVSLGTDKFGNAWVGDYVLLTFGGVHNIYGYGCGVPVIVNARCTSSPNGQNKAVVPKSINYSYEGTMIEVPVIEIGKNALSQAGNISYLVVPYSCKCIADYAFYKNSSLSEVHFLNPDGVTENNGTYLRHIGNYAFAGCSSLSTAVLPENLLETSNFNSSTGEPTWSTTFESYMGTRVYKDCYSLKSVTITGDRVYIPEGTFEGCNSIRELNLDVEKFAILGKNAFAGALQSWSGSDASENFTDLVLDCDVYLGNYSLCNNSALKNVQFNGKVEFYNVDGSQSSSIFDSSFTLETQREKVVSFNSEKQKKLVIPKFCFSSTGQLDKVSFPENVETLEVCSSAFKDCGIDTLEFTGKDVTIDENGLAFLNYTSSVVFNNTGHTNLKTYAFGSNTLGSTTKVSSVNFNSRSVWCCNFGKLTSATNIIFGSSVEDVTWYDKDSVAGVTGYVEASVGGASGVYIASPNTVFKSNTTNGYIPNENYTIYGYTSSGLVQTTYYAYWSKMQDTVGFKPKWGNYISNISVKNSDNSGNKIEMVNTKGFDSSKITVEVETADNKSKYVEVPYSVDNDINGYTLTSGSLESIEELKGSDTSKEISVDITYCGKQVTAKIVFVPKAVVDFDVDIVTGAGISLVEGNTISVDNFEVTDVKYNDGTSKSVIENREDVSVKLKSGSDKLDSGVNTVEVTYGGKTKEVDVVTESKKITKVSASLRNIVRKYYPGNTLSSDDFIVNVEYNNGEKEEDYKNFTISDRQIAVDAKDVVVVTVNVGDVSTMVEVPVSPLEGNTLLASYSGKAVVEGGVVDKSELIVTFIYTNGETKRLEDDEYDLVYSPIVADTQNEVKVIYKNDVTKFTSIWVAGQKADKVPESTISPVPTVLVSPTDSSSNSGESTHETSIPQTLAPTESSAVSQATNTPSVQATGAPTTQSSNPTQSPVVPGGTSVSMGENRVPNDGVIDNAANTGITKLAKTKYTLGVKEKVTIKLTGGSIVSAVSENTKIATVTEKGIITAMSTGTVKVEVVDNYGITKTITVTVKKAPKRVTANVKSKTLKVGKKFTIKPKFVSGYYSNKITFKSSNKKVATVNSSGVVMAKKKGTTKITLKTYNGKKTVITVKVK